MGQFLKLVLDPPKAFVHRGDGLAIGSDHRAKLEVIIRRLRGAGVRTSSGERHRKRSHKDRRNSRGRHNRLLGHWLAWLTAK
jgi:hypothetical protein